MINDVPTVYEVVTGAAIKQAKELAPTQNNSSKNKSSARMVTTFQNTQFLFRFIIHCIICLDFTSFCFCFSFWLCIAISASRFDAKSCKGICTKGRG